MNHRVGARYRHKQAGYVGRLLAVNGKGRLILRVRDDDGGLTEAGVVYAGLE